MGRVFTLLSAPVLISGVLIGGWGTANASLPSAATLVPASAGSFQFFVDGHLKQAASISGTITSAVGGLPASGTVTLFKDGEVFQTTFADGAALGSYGFGGLFAGRYAVCVGTASGGGSSTGLIPRCYPSAPWNGVSVPSGATRIMLTTGQQRVGIDMALPSAASISGRVRAASGTGLGAVAVIAHNRSSGRNFPGTTAPNGQYTLNGLPASANGYTVCFDPRRVSMGTGFLPECYRNIAWGAGENYPAAATPVPVTLGWGTSGIGATVARAGAVSGRVSDARNGHPVQFVEIDAYSASGRFLGVDETDAHGRYAIGGLAAATSDHLCVGRISRPSVTWHGQCWRNAPWNGGPLPAGATGVNVSLGQTHTGVNLKLSKTTHALGSISGFVRTNAGSHPLHSAQVTVFRSDGLFFGSTTTSSTGHFRVGHLRASSTGYVVCATGLFATAAVPTPASGWAPRCYDDVQWNGKRVPGSATRLPLAAGQDREGINISLRVGGAITGTAYLFGTATPVPGVVVKVFTTGGLQISGGYTASPDGTYTITGLSPSPGYVVCFDGRFLDGGGYRPQCYNDIAWNGDS